MQRILRINLQSRNQGLKKMRKHQYDKYLADWKEFEIRKVQHVRVQQGYIRAEKKARREDWLRGPLAPQRSVGKEKGFYGTTDTTLYHQPEFPKRILKGPKGEGWDPVGTEGRLEDQKEWEGLGNEGNIMVGDRVVVVNGRPGLVGQIGEVEDVSPESKTLRIRGLNMADISIPPNFPDQRQSTKFNSLTMPLSIDDVRLIHRLIDPTTGRNRDVVVDLIRGGAPYTEQEQHSPLPRHTRYIAGDDIPIPWPVAETPVYEPYAADTSQYAVESITYAPSVYNSDIPAAAIEELTQHTKYSRSRRWHDEEYLRMKVLEDARAEWYMSRKLQSPKATHREEQKKEAGERTLAIKEAGMSPATMSVIELHRKQRSAKKNTNVEAEVLA